MSHVADDEPIEVFTYLDNREKYNAELGWIYLDLIIYFGVFFCST